jgi:hypothetical protein
MKLVKTLAGLQRECAELGITVEAKS